MWRECSSSRSQASTKVLLARSLNSKVLIVVSSELAIACHSSCVMPIGETWHQIASLISRRFTYTTGDQSIKQENSEWNAPRPRETVRRSPISIPLCFTAEGGGSFRVAAATASLQGVTQC